MSVRRESASRVQVWSERIVHVSAIVSAIGLLILTLLVVVDVASRNVFDKPIDGAVEATELLMPYIVFLSLAFALNRGEHVRVTILVDRMPSRFKTISLVASYALGLVFFGLSGYYAWGFFWKSFISREIMMAIVELPWWVGKFAFPIGFFVMVIALAALLIQTCLGTRQEAQLREE